MAELPTGTVTFLFTDVEGSTRLLKQLKKERYSELLDELQRLLRSVFVGHGGQEIDTQGDSFFVAFRAAKDALAAAAAAQRALAGHDWPERVAVRVRMGLHTGEPVRGRDRYVGLGVHRAARICSAGHGGQVLISNATRELVEDELPEGIALRDLGRQRLKDIDRPEHIFQLVVEGIPQDFPPLKRAGMASADEDGAGTLIGRDDELAELLAGLNDAVAGRGRVVLVSGEPGIGKSRLAEELASRADAQGVRVISGRCWEEGGAPAYWPWVQSLRSYVRDVDAGALRAELGAGAAEVAQIVPEIRAVFPDLPSLPALDPEGARFRLFDSTTSFLIQAAAARPLVVTLEDLHAADTPSVLLLRFAAAQLGRARILIVGTYRAEDLEPDHALAKGLAELTREPVVRFLPLGGLTRTDVARLIRVTAGLDPPDRLVTALHEETEGNPLFVGEVVRLLAAEGRLDDAARSAAWKPQIPRGLRDVIGRRLGRLSEECTRILVLASVLGREVRLDALAVAAEVSEDDLLDVLDEAVAGGIVAEVPGSLGRVRFTHTLIRDVLYNDLTPARRIRLHRRMGEILEAVFGSDSESHLAELAHHFYDALPGGDVGKAVDYARRAADNATGLFAFEEAVRLYGMALDALDLSRPPDEEARCEILLALGDAQARAGDTPNARASFLSGADVARRVGRPEQLARAALGYGGRFVWEAGRGDPNLIPLLEEALESLGEEDSALRAKLLARLSGGPLRDDPERRRRADLSEQAVAIARRLDDPATLAYVLDGRYAAIWWPDNLPERIDLASELVEVARRAEDKERELQGRHYLLLSLLERGDMTAVYREVEAKARLAQDLRQPAQQWYLAAVRSTLASFEGRFDEAESLIGETFEIGRLTEEAMAAIYRTMATYILRRLQGRLEETEEAVKKAVEDFPTYPVLRCVLAQLLAELGRDAEATEVLGSFRDDFSDLPMNDEWVFGMTLLAEAVASLGDGTRATVLYELLEPYAGRIAVSPPDAAAGAVARPLGMLAAMLGRREDAERHFEAAVALNERTGARPWVVLAEQDYASLLADSDESSDRARALELAGRALAGARELGMNRVADRAERLIARLQGAQIGR